MKIAIGATTLCAGTTARQPSRLISSVGKGSIEVSPTIEAASPSLFDRGNRVITDVVEVDYTYDTAALALAAIPTLRKAALAASGNLVYNDTLTVGPARIEQTELIEWIGCGLTMRYTIIATETY